MKENNDEPKNDKIENKNKNINKPDNNFKKNKTSIFSISNNYMMNVKKAKSRNDIDKIPFIKSTDKQNQSSTLKKQLNKTIEINNYQNPILKNIEYIKILEKRNSLLLNKNINTNNYSKNDIFRKSMINMDRNKDNNKNIIPEEKRTLLFKKKSIIRINKDKSNLLLEEKLEKVDDKKENINDNNKENAIDINKEKNNKKIYKRAFSRKITEKDRQKKINKLNKDSFGAVDKYKKKSTQFLKRDKNINNNNNLIKPKNNKIFRTKTNYNMTKNENLNKKRQAIQVKDWKNRNSINITFQKLNYNRMKTNIYDKKNDKKEINNFIKEKNTKNAIIQTKNINKKNKSMTKQNKDKDKKTKDNLELKNKIKPHHKLSMILPSQKNSIRRKSAISLGNKNTKNSINIFKNNNNKNNKNINKNKYEKQLNKSFVQTKKIIKPKNKEELNNKKNEKIKNNIAKDESESESESDEDDEDDFDIYAMIRRSKSCYKKGKDVKKNIIVDSLEESENKNSESDEEDDIESVLYGKEQKKMFFNIDNDDVEDKNSVVKCIDFAEIFLTSNNIFTENIEKNNLYKKYIQQFDEIFNKTILKHKEK